MVNMLEAYINEVEMKYSIEVVAKWIWAVVIAIVAIASIGYAAYCIYSGGTFAGGIQIGIPKFFQVTFNCTMP